MMHGPINIKTSDRKLLLYKTIWINTQLTKNAADTREIMANDKSWYYRPASSVRALPHWFCVKYVSYGRERNRAIHLNGLGSVKSYCNTKKWHTAITELEMDWSLQTTGTATKISSLELTPWNIVVLRRSNSATSGQEMHTFLWYPKFQRISTQVLQVWGPSLHFVTSNVMTEWLALPADIQVHPDLTL